MTMDKKMTPSYTQPSLRNIFAIVIFERAGENCKYWLKQ